MGPDASVYFAERLGFQQSTMLKSSPVMIPRDPDPVFFSRIEWIENVCLALVLLISTANLVDWLLPAPGWTILLRSQPMKPSSAMAALLSSLCLMLLGTGKTRWKRWISPLLAVAVILLSATVLLSSSIPALGTELANAGLFGLETGMTPQSAGTFLLLGLPMLAMTSENRYFVRLSDLLTLLLCVSTLTLASGYLFSRWSIFGGQEGVPASQPTIICLFLLTLITVLRRAEDGVFSIFAGTGNGGKLARLLSPILLLMPFLRESSRARIIGVGTMPAYYVTALLASAASVLSISLLLYLVWRIDGMETEIHALALRDELTGLHNLRGFQLFADQAMRMAQRSKVPFSVVFIDLDGLKTINDSLGHQVGSAYIGEAAEILRGTFRETDVLGRIGGDEFAVAGEFSRRSMAVVAQRLKDDCTRRNSSEKRQYPLSLSVGYATLEKKETLDQLMARADDAMYEAKRKKKDQQGDRETTKTQDGRVAANL